MKMKKSVIKTAAILFVASLGIHSCKKAGFAQKEEVDPANTARVKFGYFTPWIRNSATQIKVNDTRVSNTFTYAISYPGGGFNMGGQSYADYIAIDGNAAKAGVKIDLSVPKVGTNTDSIPLFSGNFTNLQVDKRQTIMFTDSVPNIQATVISDEVADPPGTTARFKFFNGIPNVGANVDLYATYGTPTNTVLLASNIPYKGVSGYTDMPATGSGNITFLIVRTGQAPTTANSVGGSSTNNPYTTSLLRNEHVYTILARGFVGFTGTDVRRPQVSIVVTK
jgi:hypothetical protein